MLNGKVPIILIDSDTRRRAALSHRLSVHRIHVEPFEDVTELIGSWRQSGLVLIHDENSSISLLMDHMGHTGEWLPVVAFAEEPVPKQIVEAIQNGAVDYLGWPLDDSELISTLEGARDRASHMSPAKLREAMARSRVERLSGREREVLSAVASGLSNQLIAAQLGISCRTVESHRANMLNKIGANHISEAIRVAIEASLVN